jgi:hypothetical protein
MNWLLIIFFFLPGLFYLSAGLASSLTGSPPNGPLPSLFKLILGFIWHGALSSAYMMTYPAIQAGCPSLKIIRAISSSMPRGMTGQEIIRIFPEESLFSDRFNDLIDDGLISRAGINWKITNRGRFLARFFLIYRRILNLPPGGG